MRKNIIATAFIIRTFSNYVNLLRPLSYSSYYLLCYLLCLRGD